MPRARLNKERILRAAINLVDEGGLDELSMRNLGDRLGAGAMSLYNHVAGKEEILDGIIELVVREIHVPKPGTDWRASMRQRAISTREVILRHPWASRLIESQTNLGPSRLKLLDATLGSLRKAGFSIEDAARAVLLMDSYIYGFTLQETSWRFDTSSAAAAAEPLREHADAFPYLSELMSYVLGEAGRDSFKVPLEFEVGFELTLDAMEKLIGAK